MFSRRAASEFPNDNPELHDGLVWACPAPLGRALPTLRLREVSGALPRVLGPSWETPPEASPAKPDESAVLDDGVSTPLEAVTEPSGGTLDAVTEPESSDEPFDAVTEPQSSDEPFDAVTEPPSSDETLDAVTQPPLPTEPFGAFVSVLARIALARGATRAAAGLTALCEHGRVAPGALDDAALRALVAGRVLAPSGTHITAGFRATLDAWRGVLDGSASDLSACGASTLDSWAAELLAAVLNAPSGVVPELRRELRRAGVAAFGLLAVA